MVAWMTRIGWFAVVVGALLWTPLADVLPVDLWVQLEQLFSGTPPGPVHTYQRVIPAQGGSVDPIKVVGAVLVVLGLFLVAGGRWMRSRH
jgi:hypothetical protein